MFVPRPVVAALGVGAMQAQSTQESAVDGGDTATTGVAKGRVVVIVLTAIAALVLVLVAMLYWRYQQHAEVEELVVQARVALDALRAEKQRQEHAVAEERIAQVDVSLDPVAGTLAVTIANTMSGSGPRCSASNPMIVFIKNRASHLDLRYRLIFRFL